MKIRLFFLFVMTCSLMHAQPLLTRNNIFEIGDSAIVYHKSDASLVAFNPGPSGANVTWDCSAMDFTHPSVSADTVYYIDPAGTPYYPSTLSANYSRSNLCYIIKTNPFSPFNSDYNYCYIDNDSLSFIGHWASGGGNEIWEDHCTDFLKLMIFPFAYQNNFLDSFQRFYFDMSGSDAHYITGTHSVTADAYGTLITPDGTTLTDVLRVHTVESVRDSNAFFGITNRTQHNYYWYSENSKGYILRLEMSSIDSAVISSAYYQKQTNLVSAVDINLPKAGISLFPNPGTDRFWIVSPLEENATAEIYNYTGQIVQTIWPIARGSNELDLSFLPSGIYVFKVATDQISFSQKLVVN